MCLYDTSFIFILNIGFCKLINAMTTSYNQTVLLNVHMLLCIN